MCPRAAAGQARQPAEELQVLPAGEVLVHGGGLARQRDLAAHRGRLLHDVLTEHGGASAVCPQQHGQDAHSRGLAGTVARPMSPDQGKQATVPHPVGDRRVGRRGSSPEPVGVPHLRICSHRDAHPRACPSTQSSTIVQLLPHRRAGLTIRVRAAFADGTQLSSAVCEFDPRHTAGHPGRRSSRRRGRTGHRAVSG
jgi:hypothetical protein